MPNEGPVAAGDQFSTLSARLAAGKDCITVFGPCRGSMLRRIPPDDVVEGLEGVQHPRIGICSHASCWHMRVRESSSAVRAADVSWPFLRRPGISPAPVHATYLCSVLR